MQFEFPLRPLLPQTLSSSSVEILANQCFQFHPCPLWSLNPCKNRKHQSRNMLFQISPELQPRRDSAQVFLKLSSLYCWWLTRPCRKTLTKRLSFLKVFFIINLVNASWYFPMRDVDNLSEDIAGSWHTDAICDTKCCHCHAWHGTWGRVKLWHWSSVIVTRCFHYRIPVIDLKTLSLQWSDTMMWCVFQHFLSRDINSLGVITVIISFCLHFSSVRVICICVISIIFSRSQLIYLIKLVFIDSFIIFFLPTFLPPYYHYYTDDNYTD